LPRFSYYAIRCSAEHEALTLGTFKSLCLGVSLDVGLDVGSQTGTGSRKCTMIEVIEWWRGTVLGLLNVAIEARGGARMEKDSYVNRVKVEA